MSGHKDREGRISKYDIARPDPTLSNCVGKSAFAIAGVIGGLEYAFSGGNVTTAHAILAKACMELTSSDQSI